MLKGLDALLNADLLHVLRAMGHGDELVIVDANFPAASMGRRVVALDGVSATRALEAVLSVMPLDDFVASPARACRWSTILMRCPRSARSSRRSSIGRRAAASARQHRALRVL